MPSRQTNKKTRYARALQSSRSGTHTASLQSPTTSHVFSVRAERPGRKDSRHDMMFRIDARGAIHTEESESAHARSVNFLGSARGAACVEAAVGGTCLILTHGRARRTRHSV